MGFILQLLRSLITSCSLYKSIKTALNGCVDEIKKTDEISEEIFEKVQNLGKDTVTTKKIGDLILRVLKEKDKIGYVRFYGVFKKISDPKEYKKIVDTLHWLKIFF